MSGSELRNLIQYAFREMLSLRRHEPKSFRVGFLAGYIVSKIDTQQYSITQLEKIHDKISDIISEFVFKEAPVEFDIDELLDSLHKELAESIDNVDAALQHPSSPENIDAEIEEVLAEMEAEYKQQVQSIKEDDEHIKKNADKYKKIYHQVCDFITTEFDDVLMAIDRLEESQWLADETTPIRIGELRRVVIQGSEEKLRELLNGNENEMRLFHMWLKQYEGGDMDAPGDAWIKDI